MQGGRILRLLQSDWLWEWTQFFYLARQPGRNPRPGCVSLCDDLKFPFFDTKTVYIQKEVFQKQFVLDKRHENIIQISCVLHSLPRAV